MLATMVWLQTIAGGAGNAMFEAQVAIWLWLSLLNTTSINMSNQSD